MPTRKRRMTPEDLRRLTLLGDAQISPDGADQFAYLAQGATDGARASEAASGPPILFADVTTDEE